MSSRGVPWAREVLDLERCTPDADEPYERQADRIRPARTAGGEHAPQLIVQKRDDLRLEPPRRPVERPQQPDVREPGEVADSHGELLVQFHRAGNSLRRDGLEWHSLE